MLPLKPIEKAVLASCWLLVGAQQLLVFLGLSCIQYLPPLSLGILPVPSDCLLLRTVVTVD